MVFCRVESAGCFFHDPVYDYRNSRIEGEKMKAILFPESQDIPLLSVVKIKDTGKIGIVCNKSESGDCGLYIINTSKDIIYNYRAWYRQGELSILRDSKYDPADIVRMVQAYDMRD